MCDYLCSLLLQLSGFIVPVAVRVGMLGGKWRLNMLPWRYMMGNMLQCEAEVDSLPMGEQRDEGRLVLRILDFFFLGGGGGVYIISQ